MFDMKEFWPITLAIAIMAAGVGTFMGHSNERDRIYNSCLEKHSTLQYGEAKQKCKELVK